MKVTDGPDKGFHICDVCGKHYIRPACSLYKQIIDGRVKNACSYTCYNKLKAMKRKEN